MHRRLESFIDWVRTTDAHSPHRLPLLDQAGRILDGREAASLERRQALATALERWRYQHLNEFRGRLGPEDRQLIDSLDLAMNELAERAPRAPRAARWAVHDPDYAASQVAAALDCLDPQSPLEEVTRHAESITHQRFGDGKSTGTQSEGRRMLLYAPLYLSSHCINHCLYCGFRFPLPLERKHLTIDQVLQQADILLGRGYRQILLVAGDYPSLTTTQYFVGVLRALQDAGARTSIEIAPQSTASYAEMVGAGSGGLTLFQETYDIDLYTQYHPRGSKVSYDWRLEGTERAAEAGMQRLGLGVLLGLADPRADLTAVIRHAHYLQERFPDRTLAFSLPRLHQAPPGFHICHPVDDDLFVRMYCALRAAFPAAELVLSTRETAALRDRLMRICITQISAGSSTAPGGYRHCEAEPPEDGQFPITDHRTLAQVVAAIREAGLEPIWDPASPNA